MGDLLFVAIVVAFFAVTLAYVKGCELIVGPDTPLPDDGAGATDGSGEDADAALAGAGGPAAPGTVGR